MSMVCHRSGRNGQAFTWTGPLNLRNARHPSTPSRSTLAASATCAPPTAAPISITHQGREILGAMCSRTKRLHQQLMHASAMRSEKGVRGIASGFRASYFNRHVHSLAEQYRRERIGLRLARNGSCCCCDQIGMLILYPFTILATGSTRWGPSWASAGRALRAC